MLIPALVRRYACRDAGWATLLLAVSTVAIVFDPVQRPLPIGQVVDVLLPGATICAGFADIARADVDDGMAKTPIQQPPTTDQFAGLSPLQPVRDAAHWLRQTEFGHAGRGRRLCHLRPLAGGGSRVALGVVPNGDSGGCAAAGLRWPSGPATRANGSRHRSRLGQRSQATSHQGASHQAPIHAASASARVDADPTHSSRTALRTCEIKYPRSIAEIGNSCDNSFNE